MAIKLNLVDADEQSFDPVPTGRYNVEIHSIEPVKIAADSEGKLPPNTPGMNVRFRILDEETADGTRVENRAVFRRYYFAPEGYEKKKAMDGMLVRFLKAVGEEEDVLKSGKYELEPEELVGRECVVQVTIRGDFNDVKNVYPAGTDIQPGAAQESATSVW